MVFICRAKSLWSLSISPAFATLVYACNLYQSNLSPRKSNNSFSSTENLKIFLTSLHRNRWSFVFFIVWTFEKSTCPLITLARRQTTKTIIIWIVRMNLKQATHLAWLIMLLYYCRKKTKLTDSSSGHTFRFYQRILKFIQNPSNTKWHYQ